MNNLSPKAHCSMVKGLNGRPTLKYYFCKYHCGSDKVVNASYPGMVIATPETIDSVLIARGLGEWTDCEPTNRLPRHRPLYEKLGKDGCTIEVLHYAMFIGELAINSGAATIRDIIGDRGLVHEMIHVMQFPDEPLNPSLKDLVDMALKIEQAIPGHPLTSRLSRERQGHSS